MAEHSRKVRARVNVGDGHETNWTSRLMARRRLGGLGNLRLRSARSLTDVRVYADLGAPTSGPLPDKPLTVVHHPEFLRNGSTVDMDIALRIFNRNWEPDSPDAPHQVPNRSAGRSRSYVAKGTFTRLRLFRTKLLGPCTTKEHYWHAGAIYALTL